MATGLRAPDRLIMNIDGLSANDAKWLALLAAGVARTHAPKLTGRSASRIIPIFGEGWFGIKWSDDYVWYQNSGVNPFVMRALAGKTIPLWIDDPTGEERRKNPKAQVRVTESGKTQVLIFRRAAKIGDRKQVIRRTGGIVQKIWVPKSYPGAPGRIALREAGVPFTPEGRVGGRIARGNVGLRWYFPGLSPRNFLQHGLIVACDRMGVIPGPIRTGFDFYSAKASLGDTIPAYPHQPLADRMKAMKQRPPRTAKIRSQRVPG